jgi:WD40 repeat protein
MTSVYPQNSISQEPALQPVEPMVQSAYLIVTPGKEVVTFSNHSNWVNDLAWSADGNKIVTGSKDNSAKVFDLTTNSRISTYTGHDGSVYSVTFDETGEHVLSACSKGKVLYWKTESGQAVKELANQSESIFNIAALDAAEHFIFSGAMPSIEMIDLQVVRQAKSSLLNIIICLLRSQTIAGDF